MERNSFWLWTRMKLSGSIPTSASESWEERAFAEDTSGRLGSCVWPPRSYSCSFCQREFRSAQALGGHMNVHRRDRARLRQSSPPTTLENKAHNEHQPQRYANPNNPISSPTRFLLPSTQQVNYSYEQNHRTLPCSTPVCKGIQATSDFFPTHKSLSDLFLPETGVLDSLAIWIKKDDAKARCIGCKEKRSHKEEDEDGECFTSSCKKQRMNNETPSPLSRRLSSSDDPPQLEEVDLELRLGNPPKVKYNLNESSTT